MRTFSVGPYEISCHFLVKAKTHLFMKEDIIGFEKIGCHFFLSVFWAQNLIWRPK